MTGNGNLTQLSKTSKLGMLPQKRAKAKFLVRVRTLRTQQRVTCQCQYPVLGLISNDQNQTDSFGSTELIRASQLCLPVSQQFIYGEFDPGSGRTLAACLTHASRTVTESLLS